MRIPAYHVNAFTAKPFAGNPAMVCLLERWLEDKTLQLIARENSLPVTAFVVEAQGDYELRWFTPGVELPICGHGTIAAAMVLLASSSRESVRFQTQGGTIPVTRQDPFLAMDLPVRTAVACALPETLVQALGREPADLLQAENYLAVYATEKEIQDIAPDFERLQAVEALGVIVTAPGETADYVSRYFAPRLGIPEDAATGSTHCSLAPYWARRLGQNRLHAVQLSQRGGELWCELREDRVRVTAGAVRYAEGFLDV